MYMNYYWWFVIARLRLLSFVLYVSEGLCDLSDSAILSFIVPLPHCASPLGEGGDVLSHYH